MTSMESCGMPPSCSCYHQPLRSFNRDSPFLRKQNNAKRKSAVELLQETKPLYVKSEIVLDRKQVLPGKSLRSYETLGSPVDEDDIAARAFGPINGPNNHLNALTPILKSPRLIPPISVRRSIGLCQLQNKLRKLINTDSKENLHASMGEEESGKTECMSWSCGLPNFNNVINENNDYYKSLPDLSKNDDESQQSNNDLHLSLTLTRNNSGKKGRIQIDAMSSISCKNGHLHISTLEDNSCSKSDNSWIIDDNVQVTSPISPSIGCIPPPPAYCDKKPEDEECGIDSKIRSKSDSDRRASVDSITLDTFFDNLGLGSSEYQSLMAPRSDTSSPVYFSSGSSSLDSVGGKESGRDHNSINYVPEGLSIVERNARIIKWLCNCRKSLMFTKHKHIAPPHSA